MAATLFSTLRHSFFGKLMLSSVLSNLIIFAQPLQDALYNRTIITERVTNSYLAHDISNRAYESPDTPNPTAKSISEKKWTGATYYAQEYQGTIGKSFDSDAENPFDNYFTVTLPIMDGMDAYDVVMAYDLYGVSGAGQTTKSINNFPATGGKVVVLDHEWKSVRETIAAEQLKPGENEVFFNRRLNNSYQYKIKNLRLEFLPKSMPNTLELSPVYNYNGTVHFYGRVCDPSLKSVRVEGRVIPVEHGFFEAALENIPDTVTHLHVSYEKNGTTTDQKVAVIVNTVPVAFLVSAAQTTVKEFYSTPSGRESHQYAGLNVALQIKDNPVQGQLLTVTGLYYKDVRTLTDELYNVTGEDFDGYRVSKTNVSDTTAVTLRMKYDQGKIPEGYSAKDVRTYYFDGGQHSWKALPVDSLDLSKQEIVSTSYFNETDYINGVIKVPESPEAGSFAPTTITDMKYADPTSGIVSVMPPSANSTGAVSTSFPLKLPQGRNGMQPSLSVNYNSEAGNSWMGVGWNVATPAVTLNTKWGAPKFDGSFETEMYALEGTDLVLNTGTALAPNYTSPHRQENIARQSNRPFFARKEGAYATIVRNGTNTSNYWWEVTDKQGNKSYYGGLPGSGVVSTAVIRSGGTGGSICHWALTRMQDPFGNYIEYTYSKEISTLNGTTSNVQKFYPDKITYTRHSSIANYYEIAFKRNAFTVGGGSFVPRADAILNSRGGYTQLIDELLTEIHVSMFEGGSPKRIRTYRFDYSEQKFKKQQLSKISEYDMNNVLFYSNTLEYYDDIGTGGLINGTTTGWNGPSPDAITSPLELLPGVTNIIPTGSALGTTVSSGSSYGARGGGGLGTNIFSVSNTVGGSKNGSSNDADTRVTFIDINGDGLPDKVYKNGNSLYYRPNTGSGFGSSLLINGISRMSRTKSNTRGGGGDANLAGFGIGFSKSTTTSATDHYFTDFNGDGVPDVVSDGRVIFNTSGNSDNMTRNFTTDVGLSENTINSGTIDASLVQSMVLPTLAELREVYPQFDHVKTWQAPYTGTVTISAPAKLIAKNSGCTNNNFRLTVQRNNTLLSAGLSAYTLANVNQEYTLSGTLVVNKGDILYFRIHNLSDGCGGEVKWAQNITYTNFTLLPNAPGADESANAIHIYNADNDFIMNNGGAGGVDNEVISEIRFNLPTVAPNTYSDDIKFTIKRTRTVLQTGAETYFTWTRTLNANASFSGNTDVISSPAAPPTGSKDTYEFMAESDSNVNWDAINWKPSIISSVTGTQYPPVNYATYDENVYEKKYWFTNNELPAPVINNDDGALFMRITHNFFSTSLTGILNNFDSSEFPVKVGWVVKGQTANGVIRFHKRAFYIYRLGQVPGGWNYKFTKTANINDDLIPSSNVDYYTVNLTKSQIKSVKDVQGKLFSGFYVSNKKITTNNASEITSQLYLGITGYTYSPIVLSRPFHAYIPTFFGTTHRGWSQFLYNGGYKFEHDEDGNITNPNNPMDFGAPLLETALFNLDNQGVNMQNVPSNVEPEDAPADDTPIRYTFYVQDNNNKKYTHRAVVGAQHGIISGTGLGPSTRVGRFGEANLYDVYINPNDLVNNQSGVFFGMVQRSESKGTATSGNFSYGSATESEATSNVLNQYIDLNGDRYPDLVSKGKIQYTSMLGGLSGNVKDNTGGFVSGDSSTDATIGATLASNKPNSTETASGDSNGNKTITNISSGINYSNGSSRDSRQWVDLNGDGLTDKVIIGEHDINVQLNTGYAFTEEFVWGSIPNDLRVSRRENISASPGLSFGASFALGFGASRSTANIQALLTDVNGDGLPDLVVETSNNTYVYYLNTGKGFNGTQGSFYNGRIEEDLTVSGNVYGSVTGGFTFPVFGFPVKVVATPSGGLSANYSQKNVTLQDINGDGYVDILEKGSNNNNINANLNRMGKTHLLRKVNTPLGGSWTVEYQRDGNIYDMPSNKWVLSAVRTHDGFEQDVAYKPNTTVTTFTYSQPKYDRREREFFGYAEVSVEQRYPVPGNETLFRKSVTYYHNENYYLSGAEKGSAVYDGTGGLISETSTLYNILHATQPVVNMEATAATHYLQANLVSVATALLEKSRLFVAPVKITNTIYEQGQSLTTVKEFTAFENGNLTTYIDRGEGPDDAYKTVITYHPSNYFTGIQNAISFPSKVVVYKNSNNAPLRERTAQYIPANGKLLNVSTKLNQNDNNTVSFSYDIYGNLTTVNDLNNLHENGSNYYVKTIGYDTAFRTYPATFGNSFGETASMQYNYYFGIPILNTDENSNSMRTRIDNRGRIVEVAGPNEFALGTNGWTIRMQYKGENNTYTMGTNGMRTSTGSFNANTIGATNPTAAQHYAVTRHFDPEYAAAGSTNSTNQFLTISIVDGFGQPVQLKKTHFSGGANRWLVTGFDIRDAFGRTLKSYLPTTQAYTSDINTIQATSLEYLQVAPNSLPIPTPVEMTYDNRDRVLTTKQIDETAVMSVAYNMEEGMFTQETTNENGGKVKIYTDVRGRQRKTIQNDEITTGFEYNAINELLKVIDNDGFPTVYKYDFAGRKTEMQHPDRGVITFKYDRASRMTEQSNSNLLVENQKINYYYDAARLVRIEYPQVPQNQVKYLYGAPGNPLANNVNANAIGRLLYQEDASGVQLFSYGKMGEVTKNLRSVATAGYQSFWVYTEWKYDSWNRVQEITYPDQEVVKYHYNTAGALQGMTSEMNGGQPQNIVSNITYTNFGERQSITHGFGTGATTTNYSYDTRRRLSKLQHNFTNFQIAKEYDYDPLSNIEGISTAQPQGSMPGNGQLGGPITHEYTYDLYNRLIKANGNYTGPDDFNTPYLRQQYTLEMEYNTDHTIKKKTQKQWQGNVTSATAPLDEVNGRRVAKTSYELEYEGYGTAAFVSNTASGAYGYQQPHAPRAIKETPTLVPGLIQDDPRIKENKILYDRNGNQTEIKETVGEVEISLRKNIWDEENRLRAVNLKPDDPTAHPLAIYTYDAGGQRIVRYNYDRIDIASNARNSGEQARENVMVYPSGLLMGKPRRLRKGSTMDYTKHYYIGSERIAAKTGSLERFGDYPEQLLQQKMNYLTTATASSMLRIPSNQSVTAANGVITTIHGDFNAGTPSLPSEIEETIGYSQHILAMVNTYYFHPDHLGSSSYITNSAGVVTQHMEYLPFGETLVDEHLNSNNSPFKFNGKEFDEETGNYYYSARYYDPKLSIFISVDPLAEQTMDAYGYCYNNPIILIDPDGKSADSVIINDKTGEATYVDDNIHKVYVTNQTGYNSVEKYKDAIAQKSDKATEYLNNIKEGGYELNMESDLGKIARTVYSEMSGLNTTDVDRQVVAESIINRKEDGGYGKTYSELLVKKQYNAIGKDSYKSPFDYVDNIKSKASYFFKANYKNITGNLANSFSAAFKAYKGIGDKIEGSPIAYVSLPRTSTHFDSNTNWKNITTSITGLNGIVGVWGKK